MQECGKKCGIDNTEEELYYNFRAVPLPVLAGGQRPGEVSSAIFGGRVSPFFLLTYTL